MQKAQAETSGFGGSLGGATSGLGKLAGALAGAGAGIAAAGAAFRQLDQFVAKSAEAMLLLRNRAAGVSVSVQDFEALTSVFAKFGLDSDDVNDALNEINIKLGDAANGVGGVKDAFETLGISIRDSTGALRNNVDVWNDLVAAVEKGASADVVNAVDAILGGDIARRALPLLQQAPEAYRRLVEEAQKLVTPVSTARALAEDHVDRLIHARRRQLALNKATDAWLPFLKDAREIWTGIVEFIAKLSGGDGRIGTVRFFQQLVDDAEALGDAGLEDRANELRDMAERLEDISQLNALEVYRDDVDALRDAIKEAREEAELARTTFQGFANDAGHLATRTDESAERFREWVKARDAARAEANTPLSPFDFTPPSPIAAPRVSFVNPFAGPATEAEEAARKVANLAADALFDEYRKAIESGAIEIAPGIDAIGDRLAGQAVTMADAFRSLDEQAVDAALQTQQAWENVGYTIGNLIQTTRSWEDLLRNVGALAFRVLGHVLGGGSVGSFFGFRQFGGPVASGRPYIVGEAGPELFVPSQAGTVVANNRVGGAAANVTINFTGSRDDFTAFQNNMQRILPDLQRALNPASVLDG